jgi:hypothetical protein
VAVPRHWSQKRKYLQGKRGLEKPPFKLPEFIEATGIGGAGIRVWASAARLRRLVAPCLLYASLVPPGSRMPLLAAARVPARHHSPPIPTTLSRRRDAAGVPGEGGEPEDEAKGTGTHAA